MLNVPLEMFELPTLEQDLHEACSGVIPKTEAKTLPPQTTRPYQERKYLPENPTSDREYEQYRKY